TATFLMLAACTSGDAGTNDGGESKLNTVLEKKEIKIGVMADAPPWGVEESSGEYKGFDIDIAEALADSLNAEATFVSTTNESRIPMLETDKVDIVIAALTSLDERAQKVEMTVPYAATGQVVLAPKNSGISDYDDLSERKVAATRGSIPATILETKFPEADAVLFESVADST